MRSKEKVLTEYSLDRVGLIKPGDELEHPLFGVGKVEDIFELGDGTNTIRILFEAHGSKALVPEYANLSKYERKYVEMDERTFMQKVTSLFGNRNT